MTAEEFRERLMASYGDREAIPTEELLLSIVSLLLEEMKP
jgi:hypothetical protein